jgi:hypothetical protein
LAGFEVTAEADFVEVPDAAGLVIEVVVELLEARAPGVLYDHGRRFRNPRLPTLPMDRFDIGDDSGADKG